MGGAQADVALVPIATLYDFTTLYIGAQPLLDEAVFGVYNFEPVRVDRRITFRSLRRSATASTKSACLKGLANAAIQL